MVEDEDFRRLLGFMPVAIYAHVGGDVLYANRAMVKLFGVTSADDIVGVNSLDLYPAEARERARRRRDENTARGGHSEPGNQTPYRPT